MMQIDFKEKDFPFTHFHNNDTVLMPFHCLRTRYNITRMWKTFS